MSEIDKELLRRKLEILREYIQKLQEFRSMDEQTFLIDYHNFGLAEHYLQLAIELVLDVCRHFIVAMGLKTSEDSRGFFELLAKNGILTQDFFEKNKNMSGFRNRLVHEYSEINHKRVYQYLQDYFDEFEKFIVLISKYLERQEK